MRKRLGATLLLLACALPALAQPAFGPQILPIKEDLYRFGNGMWHGIFLVTEEGIVLADPISPEIASWLKAELAERFDVPVKYVVYSHSHFDHVEGGEVFRDTATFIAHEGVRRNMDGRYPHMPGDMIDRNLNGSFDREDIDIPTLADPGICGMSTQWFDQIDLDGDGIVPPAEFFARVVKPDLYYSERMTLTLGGKTVELLHPGRNHGDDMTVLHFPEEKVVFASDMIADALVRDDIRSIPSACGPMDGTPIDEWLASYRFVYNLDFEIFAGGHGALFTKDDVAEPIRFLEDLRREVDAALSRGLSIEEAQQEILLKDYQDWAYYERLRAKAVEAAYLNMSQSRR